MERKEIIMFNFRIINLADGNQIIDPSLKTPYDSLTPFQMVEYTEMDERLSYMDRVKRKARMETERQRKITRNPFYKLACGIGLL